MKTKSIRLFILLGLTAGLLAGCQTKTETPEPDPLQGTAWTLVSLDSREVLAGEAVFGLFDGEWFKGSAGCNCYGSRYETYSDSLLFEGAYSYDLLCIDKEELMEQEDRYLNELRRVKTYTLSGDRLEMKDERGEVILTFQKGFPEGISLDNFCTTGE